MFKEDKIVNDSQFNQYLSQKIKNYYEGGQIDEDRLLALAKDKYKTLVCLGNGSPHLKTRRRFSQSGHGSVSIVHALLIVSETHYAW